MAAATTVAAAAALTGGAAIVTTPRVRPDHDASVAALRPSHSTVDELVAAVRRTQLHLVLRPDDWPAWAELGMSYVQLARITADLSWYPRADEALHRGLAIQPGNTAALIGLGALAAGRHDFALALRLGTQAVHADAYSAAARGVVADALVELGRYDEAYAAIQAMVDLRPDTGSYARASYALELRGQTQQAVMLMQRALDVAPSIADIGFTRYHLAELAFGAGDLAGAETQVAAGLTAAPGYRPLLVTRAKILAAHGDLTAAVDVLRPVVAAMPLPAYTMLLGELLDARGDHAGAQAQDDLVQVESSIQATYGVNIDLDLVLFHADHGAPQRALADAEAGYAQRPTIAAEDALAWALHVNHRDAPALAHATAALRLGTREALFFYHRGMIEKALGRADPARLDLRQALDLNPFFSFRQAPTARAALAALAGQR